MPVALSPTRTGASGIPACADPAAAAVMATVLAMPVCQKRLVFKTMREHPDMDADHLFPRHGITAGQFALMQILSEGHRG